MWTIDNRTPYATGKTWGRDKDGVHQWIVCVKGTFDIRPDGKIGLSDEQLQPLFVPEYNGEAGLSSLRYDADLVLLKPTTDVVLNGTAYAPGGRSRTEFLVGLKVGHKQKVLKVKGNQRWSTGPLGGAPSAPQPVTSVPILYERAFGGHDRVHPDPVHQRIDSRNPVGCGVVADLSHRAGQPLPNFEYPEGNLEAAGPAGFGAIDSFWSPRKEFAGAYDAAWQRDRFPLVPADWDPRALLSSPVDQRPDRYLSGGEIVELLNLTPNGKFAFALPKVHLTLRTRLDRRVVEHDARLCTVIIEPDQSRLLMLWIGSLSCRINGDYLEGTTVRQTRSQ